MSGPPYIQILRLIVQNRIYTERQEPIFSPNVTRGLNTGYFLLGPRVDLRTPTLKLNIPTTTLTPWPFHFLAQFSVSGNA